MAKDSGLVQRAFKLKYGIRFCLFVIAGMLGITLFLYLMTARTLGGSYGQAIYNIYDLKIRIFPLIFASFYSTALLALITAAIITISVLFSHKIAGPIYRIEENLKLIGSGDLTVDTRFRGEDQLVALADDINKMVRDLNHNVRSCGDALSDIEKFEERLAVLLKQDNPSDHDLKEAIADLKMGLNELKRATSGIKVKE
ncbi:MAG: methyl-accepting chemotaxis protein [Deltaproteobacteria bacterium]|nr:methyl-accepting chemotaxis protein [Deltaproteobacteria bacterium]